MQAIRKEVEPHPQDLELYRKWGVPAPKLSPLERQQRRLAWRNERSLYWRQCPMTNKRILSIYHPDSPQPVYETGYWWSDGWDPETYGRDFDFSRTCWLQF